MHQRSMAAIGSWVGIAIVIWTVAWVVAESIPVFNDLLSLIVRNTPHPTLHLELLKLTKVETELSFW